MFKTNRKYFFSWAAIKARDWFLMDVSGSQKKKKKKESGQLFKGMRVG